MTSFGSALPVAYRAALTISQEMLESARNQHWEELIALESRYVECIQHIRRLETDDSPNVATGESDEKYKEILQQLLGNSHLIQELLEERKQELRTLMSDAGSRRRVENAYSSIDRM
ncbi:flagellar protein FliT [Kushneria phosphatilytica]|nr:flagellar protein FliT [Kushneria phosphatilytica]OHV12045.1 hypothetical protein BH688_05110 [Kushneria phosphatilytica]